MKGISRAALTVTVFALTATSVAAMARYAASLNVEAERGSQGAALSFVGKGFIPNARIKLTGTRAPGAAAKQDFGMTSADEKGGFKYNKTVPCTTTKMEDAQDPVTVTATDSATNAAVTKKVESGAWVCQ